jgi:hypothetical protein
MSPFNRATSALVVEFPLIKNSAGQNSATHASSDRIVFGFAAFPRLEMGLVA